MRAGRGARAGGRRAGAQAHRARRAARPARRTPRASSRAIRSELDGHAEEVTRLEVKRHDLHAAKHAPRRGDGGALSARAVDAGARPPPAAARRRGRGRRAKELRDLIDRMGEINLNAIEEYNELETALHVPLDAEERPREGAGAARRGDRQDQQDLEEALPRDVRPRQPEVPGGLPALLPRRARAPRRSPTRRTCSRAASRSSRSRRARRTRRSSCSRAARRR